MISLAQLRCFLAVVDEMNYRRAARRLNMTQPPLTRQIQSLEQEIGARLFDRDARSVRLTKVGENFARSAQRLLGQSIQAVQDAQRIASGDAGALTIAFTAASSYVFLPRFVALLRQALPEVSLTLREMTSSQQAVALREAQIDIGLTRPPLRLPGVGAMQVYSEPLCAVVPREHPLAARTTIAPDDLHGETFITYPPVEAVYLHTLISSVLTLTGIAFADVQHVTQTHSILALVGAGLGIGLVPRSVEHFMSANVALKPMTGLGNASVDLIMAWRGDSANPACARAVDQVSRALRDPHWLSAG